MFIRGEAMISRRILTTVAAIGVAASVIGGAATAASANVGVYFSIPGILGSPPPNPSCWRWSSFAQQWVWNCSQPHPNLMWDYRNHRYHRQHR
jgi:hypothetical protein